MVPQVLPHPGTRTTKGHFMATTRIPPAGDPFTAAGHPNDQDRPHACNNGWVSMEVEVVDPETGEETEEYALYLCRRCNA
jgi:hypothetical protein